MTTRGYCLNNITSSKTASCIAKRDYVLAILLPSMTVISQPLGEQENAVTIATSQLSLFLESFPAWERGEARPARTKLVIHEGSTVADYLQHIKMIIDDLALICHSLTDEKVIVYMLNGLSAKFKEPVATFQACDSPISFNELYDKLIEYEAYLKRVDQLSGPPLGPPFTAQFN
ncbi:hypothetical protein B296_00046349 [Ensete ventricosum]|uniref:Uncharacterized protein n=1 Tax=Ensete ventricosum TaxID=4639 RepID=A0A426YKZ7_ENSVE|nr:hypothetical protein B296_00046349 [Ensete ventricosum]